MTLRSVIHHIDILENISFLARPSWKKGKTKDEDITRNTSRELEYFVQFSESFLTNGFHKMLR